MGPRNSTYFNSQGINLLKSNNYTEALNRFETAIKLDEKYSEAYLNKGVCLDNMNKYEDAISEYNKSITYDPTNPDAYFNKGISYDNLKKYDEAVECYNKAIELKPDNLSAYNNKANDLRLLKKYEESLKCYDIALKINENYSFAYNGKGCVYLDLKDYSKALSFFETALKKDPFNSNAQSNLISLCHKSVSINKVILEKIPDKNSKLNLPSCCEKIDLDKFSYCTDSNGDRLLLGGGGFGEVYKGEFCETDVAIKKIVLTPDNTKLIRNEINIMKKISHPNLIRLMAWAEDDKNTVYILSQYVEGGNLFDFLKKEKDIKYRKKLSYIQQIAKGLNYLHKRNPPIMHRDLKSLNILVSKNKDDVYITDYGLAKELTSSYSYSVGPIGTFLWTAPELYSGNPNYIPSVDIYSFGIVMWEILTQLVPFEFGKSIKSQHEIIGKIINGERPDLTLIPDEIPTELVDLMKRCWDKDISNRPSSFDDICQVLKKISTK